MGLTNLSQGRLGPGHMATAHSQLAPLLAGLLPGTGMGVAPTGSLGRQD